MENDLSPDPVARSEVSEASGDLLSGKGFLIEDRFARGLLSLPALDSLNGFMDKESVIVHLEPNKTAYFDDRRDDYAVRIRLYRHHPLKRTPLKQNVYNNNLTRSNGLFS